MKKLLILLFALALAFVTGRLALEIPVVQDTLLSRGAGSMAMQGDRIKAGEDSLQVYVCGSASPLGMGQAQACIAVVTPDHFYLIDSGAGSTENINRLRLPTGRLQAVLLTHFHSDHIAELYEVNLGSWVNGRTTPLTVYGPEGVQEVVNGVNEGYRMDRLYRVAHHGEALLAPELGVLNPQSISAGEVIQDGDLKITAYTAEHPPIHPAVGYRIDYRGRSVVVSGDSNVGVNTFEIVDGADLLLHDALSLPIVTALANSLEASGRPRQSKIVTDVIDYHASTASLIDLNAQSDIGMVAYYHLVPVPPNSIAESVFMRNAPDNFVLASDLMWFELPIGSDQIVVNQP